MAPPAYSPSRDPACTASAAGRLQVCPPSVDLVASRPLRCRSASNTCVDRCTTPSEPADIDTSSAWSNAPPVQRVRPGTTTGRQVRPRSKLTPATTPRNRSWVHAATTLARSVGLATTTGSTSPVGSRASRPAVGQPVNGLVPDTRTRRLASDDAAATAGPNPTSTPTVTNPTSADRSSRHMLHHHSLPRSPAATRHTRWARWVSSLLVGRVGGEHHLAAHPALLHQLVRVARLAQRQHRRDLGMDLPVGEELQDLAQVLPVGLPTLDRTGRGVEAGVPSVREDVAAQQTEQAQPGARAFGLAAAPGAAHTKPHQRAAAAQRPVGAQKMGSADGVEGGIDATRAADDGHEVLGLVVDRDGAQRGRLVPGPAGSPEHLQAGPAAQLDKRAPHPTAVFVSKDATP